MFGRQLDLFHKKAMEDYSKIRRMAAFEVFSAIIVSTPVAKGVLRNNWFSAIGAPTRDTTGDGQRDPSPVISRMEATVNADKDYRKDIYFTNNLPYAAVIEFDGHSGKAPHGMVRINTARWNSIVSKMAKRVYNGL